MGSVQGCRLESSHFWGLSVGIRSCPLLPPQHRQERDSCRSLFQRTSEFSCHQNILKEIEPFRVAIRGRVRCGGELIPVTVSFSWSKGEVVPAKGNLTALLGVRGRLLEPGISLSEDQGVLVYTGAVMGPEKSTNRLARGKGGAV